MLEVILKTRTCSKCNTPFQYKSNSNRPYCQKCYSIWAKDRYARGIKRQPPEQKSGNHYKRTYGITLEEYDAMFKAQGKVCAICHHPEKKIDGRTGQVQRLHVDHDHKTGKVRRLLYNTCNVILGLVDDDPAYFQLLVAYLEKHQE